MPEQDHASLPTAAEQWLCELSLTQLQRMNEIAAVEMFRPIPVGAVTMMQPSTLESLVGRELVAYSSPEEGGPRQIGLTSLGRDVVIAMARLRRYTGIDAWNLGTIPRQHYVWAMTAGEPYRRIGT